MSDVTPLFVPRRSAADMTTREAWYRAWSCLRNRRQTSEALPPEIRHLYAVAFRLYMRCYGKRGMSSPFDAFHAKLKYRLRSYKEMKHRVIDPEMPF